MDRIVSYQVVGRGMSIAACDGRQEELGHEEDDPDDLGKVGDIVPI
jgi:hypothetical protein